MASHPAGHVSSVCNVRRCYPRIVLLNHPGLGSIATHLQRWFDCDQACSKCACAHAVDSDSSPDASNYQAAAAWARQGYSMPYICNHNRQQKDKVWGAITSPTNECQWRLLRITVGHPSQSSLLYHPESCSPESKQLHRNRERLLVKWTLLSPHS